MKIKNNIGGLDRIIRFILAEVLFLVAFFWAAGVVQIILYTIAFVALTTSLFRFCGIYRVFKINTCFSNEKSYSTIKSLSVGLIIIFVAVLGSYYSSFFSKKFFLEDYSTMNQYYKQTLFYTGQNNREESKNSYTKLVAEYEAFSTKYKDYRPYVIASDTKFTTDIETIKGIILSLGDDVETGDLLATHKEFEAIRPIFQDILKRNGFSMLAVYLVDFHDAMEKVIDASDAKNAQEVIAVYSEVSDKLKAVEEVANDEEIQRIRQNLEKVISLARSGNTDALPKAAAELKSSFVKVYLKRG